MVGSTKRLYRNSKKVRKMRKSKRTISLGKNNKTGGSRRRIKVRKLKNSRRRRKYKRNFRSKRRGGGNDNDGKGGKDNGKKKLGIQEWPQGNGNLNINIYSIPEHVYYGPKNSEPPLWRFGEVFIEKMKFLDKDGKFPEVTNPDSISKLYSTNDSNLLIKQEDYYVDVDEDGTSIKFIKIPKEKIKEKIECFGKRYNRPDLLIWEDGEKKANWDLFNFIDKPDKLSCEEQDYILDDGTFYYIETYEQLALAMRSSEWKPKGQEPWKPHPDSNNSWPHSLSEEETQQLKKLKETADVEKEKLKKEEIQKKIKELLTIVKADGEDKMDVKWKGGENWDLFDFIDPKKFLPDEEQYNFECDFDYIKTYEELADAMKSKSWKGVTDPKRPGQSEGPESDPDIERRVEKKKPIKVSRNKNENENKDEIKVIISKDTQRVPNYSKFNGGKTCASKLKKECDDSDSDYYICMPHLKDGNLDFENFKTEIENEKEKSGKLFWHEDLQKILGIRGDSISHPDYDYEIKENAGNIEIIFTKRTPDELERLKAEAEKKAEEKKCNSEYNDDVLITLDNDFIPILLNNTKCRIGENVHPYSDKIKIDELRKMQSLIGQKLEVNKEEKKEVYKIAGIELNARLPKVKDAQGQENSKELIFLFNGNKDDSIAIPLPERIDSENTTDKDKIQELIGEKLEKFKITANDVGKELKTGTDLQKLLEDLNNMQGEDLKIELVFLEEELDDDDDDYLVI